MNGKRILLTSCILLSLSGHVALAATNGSYTIISSNLLTDVNGTTITNYDGGLAFDGTNLWYAARLTTTNNLYRIDPETQKVTAQWPLPFVPYGVAWDGSHLRIVDSKTAPRIRSYDLQGHEAGSQIVEAASPNFKGLAWDGKNLWGADAYWLLKFDSAGAVTRIYPNAWLEGSPPPGVGRNESDSVCGRCGKH